MSITKILTIIAVLLALAVPSAYALPVTTVVSTAVVCGVLEKFGGEVQLLNANRTDLIEPVAKAAIPCGTWISTAGDGWAQIKHRDGFKIHVGSSTFIELPHKEFGEHVVLFRGQIHGATTDGAGEFKVVTTNARARVEHGRAIVIYSQAEEETQLIAVENEAWLENRFEVTRKMKVATGEATSLNFKALRIVPTTPQAVTLADLKHKLENFRMDEKEQRQALVRTHRRHERTFASKLPEVAQSERTGRKPAGLEFYSRHTPSSHDHVLREHMVKKMVAGQEAGEKILYPDKYYGRKQPAHVVVQDPLARSNQNAQKAHDFEKSRLIEELSQIQAE